MSELAGIKCDTCGKQELGVKGTKPTPSVWIQVRDFWIGGVRQLTGDYCSVDCFFKECNPEALRKIYDEAVQEVAEVTKR